MGKKLIVNPTTGELDFVQDVSTLVDKQTQSLQTTDATPTLVTGSKSMVSNSTISFVSRITVVQSATAGGGTVGDTWYYEIEGSVKNIAGTSTLGDITEITHHEDVILPVFPITVVANDTTDALDFTVTGVLSATIEWKIETVFNENSY